MKIDYQNTINTLKENGIIQDGDKYAVCLFKPESENNGVTSTIITSKFDYIMVANDDEIKLCDIDKKTGEFLERYVSFKKDDVVFKKKIKERNFIYASRGLFGGMVVAIHFIAHDFVHDYVIPKKIRGYEQKEASLELYNFVKEVYNTDYDAKIKEYKNK